MCAPWVLVTPNLGRVCGEDVPGLINQRTLAEELLAHSPGSAPWWAMRWLTEGLSDG